MSQTSRVRDLLRDPCYYLFCLEDHLVSVTALDFVSVDKTANAEVVWI